MQSTEYTTHKLKQTFIRMEVTLMGVFAAVSTIALMFCIYIIPTLLGSFQVALKRAARTASDIQEKLFEQVD